MTTTVASLSNSTASGTTQGLSTTASSSTNSSFQAMLSQLLTPDQGQINEEQLYSALISERLSSKKGENLATAYQSLFAANKSTMTRSDGYVPIEQAAATSLSQMVNSGLLSTDEASSINAQAFKAAQLDDNSNFIYDSRGSTVAVALIENALKSAETSIQQFDSGEVSAGSLNMEEQLSSAAATGSSLSASAETSTIREFNGDSGFLYKPISESTHTLAILLPASMSDDASSVKILSSSGEVLETGDLRGDHDGRGIYRFNHPGSDYPDNLIVSVTLDDGSTKEYYIPDPSKRWE